MAKVSEKLRAIKLRQQGKSVGEIAVLLGVSKGTSSLWCKGVFLSEKAREILDEKKEAGGHRGRVKGSLKNKLLKQKRVDFYRNSGKNEVGALTDRDLFIFGIALYWAEGAKSGNKLSISNSDPTLVLIAKDWFMRILGVRKSDLMPRIFINSIHEDRLQAVVSFWSNLLSLPSEQFGKPILLNIRNKKIYENHSTYYGVLSLGVRNPSGYKDKVLGLIDAVKYTYMPE